MRNIKGVNVCLIMILLIQYFITGCTAGQEEKNVAGPSVYRKIYTGYEIGVNYAAHMYTLANAGFEDAEYVKKYGDTISQNDLKILRENADAMKFLHNEGGIFKIHLYFLPALNNFETEEQWKNYFLNWELAIEERKSSYIEPYCTGYFFNGLPAEYENISDEVWNKSVHNNLPTFKKLGDIYTRNFETYKTTVWPEIEPILKGRSNELNKRLSDIPFVDKWEEVTGYDFANKDYYIALYYAGKHGPSFNNLSLYKNSAYYNSNSEFLLDMFSHELGVHVILPHISEVKKQFYKNDVPPEVIYKAGETLATFYNEKVLCRLEKNDSDKQFMRIYSRLFQEGINNPRELYEKGIIEYMSHNY